MGNLLISLGFSVFGRLDVGKSLISIGLSIWQK